MRKFSANISTMFKERPFLDRFAAARRAGFDTVEIQFPYEFPAADVAAAKRDAGVAVDLINMPPGDYAAGERGLVALPGDVNIGRFGDALTMAIDYAVALGAKKVHCIAGIAPAGATRAACLKTLAVRLRLAADALGRRKIRALLEPINDRDMPGFVVPTVVSALAAIDAARHENLYLQADLYHMARMGEDHAAMLRLAGRRLGHVQFSDLPGRGEPGAGTLDFKALFAAAEAAGYRGLFAAEYTPTRRTEDTLGWMTTLA
jgi:hydroxypyruvate isomerase